MALGPDFTGRGRCAFAGRHTAAAFWMRVSALRKQQRGEQPLLPPDC
jgi:hypothetical protein